MNKKEFLARMFIIFEDRGLKEPKEFWINELWKHIEKIDHNAVIKGFSKIMSIGSAEWNKTYGFGGKPSITDWMGFFSSKKRLTIEQIASAECEKILYEARYAFSSHIFKNEITQKVVDSFANGIKTIHFEVFDTYNTNPKDKGWYKKNLVSKWLDYNNMIDLDTPMMIDKKVKTLLPNIKINK